MFSTKFGVKLVFATVLSFPERFQSIPAAALCTVAMNVLEPCAFNAEFQYFIPLFNKNFMTLRRGMKHQMRGCNSGPTGHDFTDDNSSVLEMFQE